MSEPKNQKGQSQPPSAVQLLQRAQRGLEELKGAVSSQPAYKQVFEAHQALYNVLTAPPVAAKPTPGPVKGPDVPPTPDKTV